MVELVENRYGKSRVRLMKVTRRPHGNELREWTIEVLVKGDFVASHVEGDNANLLATDTMKNMVYAVARSSAATTMEAYGTELVGVILTRNAQISSVAVRVESALWKRLTVDGQLHPTAFMHGSDERQTTHVECDQAGWVRVSSGLDGLVILKTAQSGFEGFRRDEFTTLPETTDRLLGTALRAEWRYNSAAIEFETVRRTIREAMLKTFAEHHSKSVQQTLYAMAESALAASPEIDEIELAMPNKHCLLVDLTRFGMDNPNEIFIPTDEPHGYIEARVRRVPEA